jgi:hypothetical protein
LAPPSGSAASSFFYGLVCPLGARDGQAARPPGLACVAVPVPVMAE